MCCTCIEIWQKSCFNSEFLSDELVVNLFSRDTWEQPREFHTTVKQTPWSYLDRRWHLRTASHISSGRHSVWSAAGRGSEGQNKMPKNHQKPAKSPFEKCLSQSSKHSGSRKHPTWWGSIAIQQVVILCGVEVHDDASSIQQLFVTAGTGDAVVAIPAVTSVVQLLWLHLATHRSPEKGEEKEQWV